MSFDQYKAALNALRVVAVKRAGKSMWKSYISLTLVSFSILFALKAPSTRLATAEFIIFIAVGLWLVSVWAKFKQQSCWKQVYATVEKQLNGQHMEVTEAGISGSSADGTTTYSYTWAAFERMIDLPDGFLFLPNTASFVRVPKETLSQAQQAQVIEWAKLRNEKL